MNIVYPLIPGFKHRDFEFLHSIRSLEKHLKSDFDVTVIGRYLPLWVKPGSIKFVPTETGRSKEALRKACDLYDDFLWMNDDIYLLQDMTEDDFKVRLYQEDMSNMDAAKAVWEEFKSLYENNKQAGATLARRHDLTKWKRRLWHTHDVLKEMGRPTKNYSIHAPYLFNSRNLLELGKEFPGIWTSDQVVETAYFNTYHQDWREEDTRETRRWVGAYSSKQGDDLKIDRQFYLNHNDDGLSNSLKKAIKQRYPSPSQFEK